MTDIGNEYCFSHYTQKFSKGKHTGQTYVYVLINDLPYLEWLVLNHPPFQITRNLFWTSIKFLKALKSGNYPNLSDCESKKRRPKFEVVKKLIKDIREWEDIDGWDFDEEYIDENRQWFLSFNSSGGEWGD